MEVLDLGEVVGQGAELLIGSDLFKVGLGEAFSVGPVLGGPADRG